jgi:hypothetical protein
MVRGKGVKKKFLTLVIIRWPDGTLKVKYKLKPNGDLVNSFGRNANRVWHHDLGSPESGGNIRNDIALTPARAPTITDQEPFDEWFSDSFWTD